MEKGIPARLSPTEGRKFGLLVGGAFLVCGGISHWRGHQIAPLVFWVLGGCLTLGGLLMPTMLGPIYRGWMRFALLLSKVTTPIFMSVVYFLVLTPTGFLLRVFGRNPLTPRQSGGGFWATRGPDHTEGGMTRQF